MESRLSKCDRHGNTLGDSVPPPAVSLGSDFLPCQQGPRGIAVPRGHVQTLRFFQGGPCNLSWRINPKSFVLAMSKGRWAKGDVGRASAERRLPKELQTQSFVGGRNGDDNTAQFQAQIPSPEPMTTPLIIVKMLVSGKLFLSLPSRGGDSSRDEGVIKEGAVKAQLSCWRWTISTTHTSVCS